MGAILLAHLYVSITVLAESGYGHCVFLHEDRLPYQDVQLYSY